MITILLLIIVCILLFGSEKTKTSIIALIGTLVTMALALGLLGFLMSACGLL